VTSNIDPSNSTRKDAASQRLLVPLYIASGVLTIGEGSFLVLISPYLESRGLGAGLIGTVVSVYGIASLATRLPAGIVYRTNRGALLVAGGCAMSALAFASIPLTGNPLLLGGLIGLDGVGFAVATTGALAALMDRRPPGAGAGSVMGWYTGSVGAGYAVAGFVAGVAGDALGLSRAFYLLAGIPLISALLLTAAFRAAPLVADSTVEVGAKAMARLKEFVRAPGLVWLAFLVTLYTNLVGGVLFTFFPIYGLAIGLSLSQIGLLAGIHGTLAAMIRFASGWMFGFISYRGALPVMILVNGAALASLGVEMLFVLVIGWSLIGVSRGVLRVASGALVLDATGVSDSEKGASSAIYLAGLDLGKILGPLIGGATAAAVGLRGTFVVLGVVFPIAYFAITAGVARAARRRRHASDRLPV
jgi:MFS family permease